MKYYTKIKSDQASYLISPRINIAQHRLNYILVYFLFAFGGVTAFSSYSRFVQLFFVFVLVLFIVKNKKIDKEFIYILCFVSIIFFGQYFKFEVFSIKNYIVLFYTFFIPYGIIKIVGKRFISYYIKITYFFAIISLFFIVPSYFSSEFHALTEQIPIWLNIDPLEGIQDNFIIYNYEPFREGVIKKTGPFYEGGAFGTFLIIALLLNLIKTRKLLEKKNILFTITILSTFSTATYLALFSLIFFFFTNNRKIWLDFLFLPIFLFIAYQSFNEFSFLRPKIETDYKQSLNIVSGDIRAGRFQSARLDLIDIKNHPFLGRGLISSSRFENKFEVGTVNGLTDLAVRYGVIGFFLFFLLIMKSLRFLCLENQINVRFALFGTIPLATVLFAQVLYPKPIFLGLMMMFILYKRTSFKLIHEKIIPQDINHRRNF